MHGAPHAVREAPPLPASIRARIVAAVTHELGRGRAASPVPGAVVGIWSPSAGSAVLGIGAARLQPLVPMSGRDRVRIGGMTFGFTVTALLRLVDERRLALDDPISRFSLPVPVRDGDRITVRNLMAMRSGLADVRDEPGYPRAAAHPATAADRLRLVALACDRPLRFAPGTRFEESATNGLLLGMILERLTGESPTRWIATQLFRPLRLAATSFPTATALPRSAAHGYAVGARDWFDVSAATQPALAWTAGGIVSSASDIRRWLDASIGGRLTAASTQRARIACRPTGESGIGYGLGLRCAGGWLGASGYAAGYSTAAYKLQSSHTIVVAFVTTLADRPAPGLANAIVRDVARIVTPRQVPFEGEAAPREARVRRGASVERAAAASSKPRLRRTLGTIPTPPAKRRVAAVPAAARIAPIPCVRTRVATVLPSFATSPRASGLLTLANGATVRLVGPAASPTLANVVRMRPGDPAVACYGPLRAYPGGAPARVIVVNDLATGGSFDALGTWPRAR